MFDPNSSTAIVLKPAPWNKGKLTGGKADITRRDAG